MRIAIVTSNCVPISKFTKKGTEIFDYVLIRYLAKKMNAHNLEITVFASGDSHLPVPIESISDKASFLDTAVGYEHHKTFEMALVSKAFSMQDKFDLYHVNIGNGDVVLPFAPFVKKPIIVTMHGSFLEAKYNKKYLSLFENLKNIYFVSVSAAQREPFQNLHYIATIQHGIDTKTLWKFHPTGGDFVIWAGRGIREKGFDTAIKCISKAKKKGKIFLMVTEASPRWLKDMQKKEEVVSKNISVKYGGIGRSELVYQYQNAKALLFPIRWEEPFGLVMIESMACGTPVVAYARGSVPEIIKDGETGFMVNPSDDDIRGNFIIKKTGIEGLVEALNRIYSMPEEEYLQMRKNCRMRVEELFNVEDMALKYIDIYKKVLDIAKTLK